MEINIPQCLKHFRESRKLTQEKVAVGISVKRATYAAYEEGRAKPSTDMLVKISAFYGFHSLDQLLGIKEEMRQTEFDKAYHSVDAEKRKIVDFILNLNC